MSNKASASGGCIRGLFVIAGLFIMIVWGISSCSADENNEPAPAKPDTSVGLVAGDGTFTYSECQALRLVALDNNNSQAVDAAVKYEMHCQ